MSVLIMSCVICRSVLLMLFHQLGIILLPSITRYASRLFPFQLLLYVERVQKLIGILFLFCVVCSLLMSSNILMRSMKSI